MKQLERACQGRRRIGVAQSPQGEVPKEDENMAERATRQELKKAYDCVVIGAGNGGLGAAVQLAAFDLPNRRTRWEVFGEVKDITSSPGFPQEVADETFRLTVHVGGVTAEVPARAVETVLVAMERANLAPPSQCRSGECGFCRSRLVSGDVYVHPESDGRRAADKQFGYIHPCSSYPTTDLEISVPRGV